MRTTLFAIIKGYNMSICFFADPGKDSGTHQPQNGKWIGIFCSTKDVEGGRIFRLCVFVSAF